MAQIKITYLPKVGDTGLAIPHHHINGWSFSNTVSAFMKRKEICECWFQCFDNSGWKWTHGIVKLCGGKAIITQIG